MLHINTFILQISHVQDGRQLLGNLPVLFVREHQHLDNRAGAAFFDTLERSCAVLGFCPNCCTVNTFYCRSIKVRYGTV